MKTLLACVTLSLLFQSAQSARIMKPDRKSMDCQVCRYVMTFIQHQTLQQALPLTAVKQKLEELYKIAPHSLQNEEYLTNLDVWVSMIEEGKDPQTICKFLRKCTARKVERPDITECQVCTAVVDLIKFELSVSNATIDVIIKAVEALCAILGDVPVYEECKMILKDLEQIVQWLEQKLDPADICIRLGLCPNKTMNASDAKQRIPVFRF